ncbi:hypothetical protein CBF23_003750 [Marinomonas agarivorans]|nr:hypothetical protein CBF23_003750 [Marinomonas agarivorans]
MNEASHFKISVRTLSGILGLIFCYSISIYFFWESQITFTHFRVDPEHSRFTRSLYILMSRDNAKVVGIIVAFLSIHFSWSLRYCPAILLDKMKQRLMFKQ